MDTNKMREQFEAAFIAEQVAKFGEGFRDSAIHLLKRDGAFLTNPSFYEVRRREQGMYDNYWVEMVWWAWQAPARPWWWSCRASPTRRRECPSRAMEMR